MKKLLAVATTLGLWITSPSIAYSQEFTTFEHKDGRYYYQTLNSEGTAYYKYEVPATTFGVFTLKNSSRQSDFDIYVFNYESGWKLLDQGENSGLDTELIVIPPSLEAKYAYIKIVNVGSRPSEYNFYANYVSPLNRITRALLTTGLTCDENPSKSKVNSRAVTAITSVLQGKDIGGLTQDMLINEISNEMRDQVGYGCTGDFMVNSTISIIKGFYRNYY